MSGISLFLKNIGGFNEKVMRPQSDVGVSPTLRAFDVIVV